MPVATSGCPVVRPCSTAIPAGPASCPTAMDFTKYKDGRGAGGEGVSLKGAPAPFPSVRLFRNRRKAATFVGKWDIGGGGRPFFCFFPSVGGCHSNSSLPLSFPREPRGGVMNGGGGVNFLRQCIPSHRLVGSTFGGGKRSIAEESAFLERVSPVECHIRKGFADGPAKMTVPAKSMPSPPPPLPSQPSRLFRCGDVASLFQPFLVRSARVSVVCVCSF